MKECFVLILLDAFRHDFLTKKTTPFLYDLAQKGIYGKLGTELGFTGLYATLFSSTRPQDNDVWVMFKYDPDNSPFRWMGKITPFLSLVDKIPPFRGALRSGLSGLTGLKSYMDGNTFLQKMCEIPFKYARLFDFSMRKHVCEENSLNGIPTLFDVLRKEKISFRFLHWPIECVDGRTQLHFSLYSDEKVCEKIEKSLRKGGEKVYYFHLWGLDTVIHETGPSSKETGEKLKELDNLLEKLIGRFKKKFKNVNVIAFADHGMTEIRRTLDIKARLYEHKIEERDYLIFLDSTLARLWFKDEKNKQEVREILREVDEGRLLTEEDYGKHHLNFSHTKYGELIFLADPRVLISPNYFQGSAVVHGMHGYDPAFPDMDGVFILNGPRVSIFPWFQEIELPYPKDVGLINVFPTMLDLMGLPHPVTCEGRSLLKVHD